MKKILHVVGARPNYVKASPVINAITFAEQVVLNTGQHYDKALSWDIVQSLEMRTPDINLVGKSRYRNTFSRLSFLMKSIYENVRDIKPDIIVLYGDIDSTLAGALVASRMGIPIAHVESGLRSFDNRMPEELNRKVVDQLSSIHFVTEQSGIDNLVSEGYDKTICFVGNSMIDSLKKIINSSMFKESEYDNNGKTLLTCHRPSNVDNKETLQKVFDMCYSVEQEIVWPLHPRTLKNMKKFNMLKKFENLKNLQLIDPLNYCDFIKMMSTSNLVITDSGGIQEETTYLKVPCLTIRENTERPSTITQGSNRLVSFEEVCAMNVSSLNEEKVTSIPELWDGNAASRIAKHLSDFLNTGKVK
jgi:UDP-N-acetylglucosamine 2-epimerase (non-hydrolysing)